LNGVAPGVVVEFGGNCAAGIDQAHDAAKAVADGVIFLRGGGGIAGAGEKGVHAGGPGVGKTRGIVVGIHHAIHDQVVAGGDNKRQRLTRDAKYHKQRSVKVI